MSSSEWCIYQHSTCDSQSDEQKYNQNFIEWHTRCFWCVCARSERNGQVYVAPCHIRETPALFFLHFFFIRCVLNVLFFSSWISTQVSELYFRSMRSVDLFFFVIIVEHSKIRIISFHFEDHYNVWKQQFYLVADDVQSKSSPQNWNEAKVRTEVPSAHMRRWSKCHTYSVFSVLKWEVEHGNRMCAMSFDIFWNSKWKIIIRGPMRSNTHWISCGFSVSMESESSFSSCHWEFVIESIEWKNQSRRSIKVQTAHFEIDLNAIRQFVNDSPLWNSQTVWIDVVRGNSSDYNAS